MTYEEEPVVLSLFIFKRQAEDIYERLARQKQGFIPPVDSGRRKYVRHAASSLAEHYSNGASTALALPVTGRPSKVYRRI